MLRSSTLVRIAATSLLCLFCTKMSAQRVSLGLVVGGYGNADFVSHYIPTPGFNPDIAISDSGGYIVGPTLEVRFVRGLSLVADALYKPLHYKHAATFHADGTIGFAPATVVTWQFPLLAKYRFSSGNVKPFLEGGPAFRTAGNLNATNPSNHGVSAGVGIEGQWRALSLAPSIRYTRWAKDRYPWSHDVQTRSDQVEFQFRFLWSRMRR